MLTKSFERVNWQHRINFSNSMINHANIHFSHWRGAKAQNDSFRNSHDGQFTFSTQFIKLNYRGVPFTTLLPPSPTQHHSFSWNLLLKLTPFSHLYKHTEDVARSSPLDPIPPKVFMYSIEEILEHERKVLTYYRRYRICRLAIKPDKTLAESSMRLFSITIYRSASLPWSWRTFACFSLSTNTCLIWARYENPWQTVATCFTTIVTSTINIDAVRWK